MATRTVPDRDAAEPPAQSVADSDPPRERDLPPLDDAAYAAHLQMVEERLDDADARGLSTDTLYTTDPNRTSWMDHRLDAHASIIGDVMKAHGDVPRDGKALIAGGLGGAGKTTVLSKITEIDTSQYLTLNPDDIKEEMAERGLIPAVDGLAPMECSQLGHEESSWIAGNLARAAYGERRNVIWDITMSRFESAMSRIDDLRKAGYEEIVGVFVDIPASTSVERAQARHRAGMEEYRNGRGYGGRHLAPELILKQEMPDGQTVNRKVFEALKPAFDRWMVFDNSVDGREPVLVESSDDAKERV